MEMIFIIIGIIVVWRLVLKFYQTSTAKNQIIAILALSITLTLMCPLVGIIPLYYSIKAWIKQEKDNPLWEKELKNAYKWAKRCAVIYTVLMFVYVILYIILMYCAYNNVDLPYYILFLCTGYLSWLFWFKKIMMNKRVIITIVLTICLFINTVDCNGQTKKNNMGITLKEQMASYTSKSVYYVEYSSSGCLVDIRINDSLNITMTAPYYDTLKKWGWNCVC